MQKPHQIEKLIHQIKLDYKGYAFDFLTGIPFIMKSVTLNSHDMLESYSSIGFNFTSPEDKLAHRYCSWAYTSKEKLPLESFLRAKIEELRPFKLSPLYKALYIYEID